MKKQIDWKYEVIDFLKTLIIAFIIVFIVTKYIVKPIRVNQNSMYPTILDQSVGVSNVIVLSLEKIDRFDIVVIDAGEENYIIKRVVGLPGETVEMINEVLYINGKVVEEPFLDETYYNSTLMQMGYFTNDFSAYTLGEDEIYCLGDNRPYSKDSRHYGAFKTSQVISKDVFFFYPFNRLGSVR